MKHLFPLLALFATPLMAQDYAANSTARSWNLYGESPARFEARVVDVLCELTGDCARSCGDGRRQLGLVRADDNVLIFPNKNAQAAFTGAVVELLPFCGMEVEVDGLLIEDGDVGATNIYLVQKIRALGDENWTKANRWTKEWAKANPDANPDAKGKGPWFRRDPRVNAAIADKGHLGLGLETDEAFIKEWFE